MQEDHKLEGSKTKLLIRTRAMKQTDNKLSNAHQLQPGAHASYRVAANHDNNEIRRVQQFSVGQSKNSESAFLAKRLVQCNANKVKLYQMLSVAGHAGHYFVLCRVSAAAV